MSKVDICSRCKGVIEPDQEIWFPKGETSCGSCTTSEEIDNYLYTDNYKENR